MRADPQPTPSEPGPQPPGSQPGRAFAFVFVTVALDMLAIGIIVPVLPNLVTEMAGGDAGDAALWIGLFGAAWATVQFLFMPILGAMGDAHGRKPVFLFSNFGQAVACALTALAPGFLVLFLARLVSGAVSASVSTAYAYVADILPPDQRAARFGQLSAAFGLGFILGPAIGGQLGKIDLHLPFWAAAAMATVNGIYGLLVLPESLPPERRTPFRWAKANPVGAAGFLKDNPHLHPLVAIKALADLAQTALPATFVLYVLHRFGWGPDMSGITLTLVGIASIAVSGFFTGRIIKRIGERRALVAGLAASALGLVLYGLAPNGWLFWAVIPIQAFGALTMPAVQSLMTRRISPQEQGRLQGAIGSVQAMMSIIGPPLFTTAFAVAIAPSSPVQIPAAPLFLAAAVCLAGVGLSALAVWRHRPGEEASGAPRA